MKRPAQLFFVSLLFTISYLLFATAPSFAQTAFPSSYTAPTTSSEVPNNLHTWTQNVMIEVMSAMTCQLAGVDPVNPSQKCLGVDPKTGSIGFVEGGGGAVGLMGNMIAMLYTPPLHTGDYFNYLAKNFGIAKPAYAQAQGIGFAGLSPLTDLWVAFRNIVYLLFVVVFVVIGLAIMLRIHIDPRTVMTIENQIPKLIIGILLVTFSFAIAGFLIDMMYVVIYLLWGIIYPISPAALKNLNPAGMQGANPFGAVGGLDGINNITSAAANSIRNIISNFLDFNNPVSFAGLLTNVIASAAGVYMGIQTAQLFPGLGIIAGAGMGTITLYAAREALITWIPWIIAYLIIFIAVLWALFRLWFELIKAYVFILIDVVLAPFWIMLGVLPGVSGFSSWLRDIVANLSVFPVTIGMFLLGKVFMDAFETNSGGVFVPPLIGSSAPNLMSSLIGLGIILMTPQVVTMTREYLKAPPFKYATAIGQAVGVGVGYPVATGKGIGGTLVSGKEIITTGVAPGGQVIWGQRGIGRGILGRIFGR